MASKAIELAASEQDHKATSIPATRAAEFRAGVRATFPLVVGAIPFGIIFGAVAVNSGLSAAAAQAMSLFVFAGSAQFIGAGLVAGTRAVANFGIEAAQVKLRSHRHAAGAVDFRPADVFGNRRLQRGFAGFAQAAHFQGHGDIPDQHPHFLAAVGGIEQFSLLIERFDPYDIPRI